MTDRATVEAIRQRRDAKLSDAIPGSLVLFEGSLDYDFATVFAYLDALTAEKEVWLDCNERMTHIVLELTEERDRLKKALEMTPGELSERLMEATKDLHPEARYNLASALNVLRAAAGLGPREGK